MDNVALLSLDYIYAPSQDVAADARWLTDVLGAKRVFTIERDGTRVAMVRLGSDAPAVLVTDHLPDERPIFLYRVASLADASAGLGGRGWTADRTLDLPMGPAMTFHAPGGLRLAIHEATRPFVVESMAGQTDF